MEKKVAVVTGSNKGIGLEICRQLSSQGVEVILTSRNIEKGHEAIAELKSAGLDVKYHQLDITNEESIDQFVKDLEKDYGKVDILINNAGIFVNYLGFKDVSIETIKETMETNFYGALLMSQKILPLMKKNNSGRIVNVSSGMGQLTDMTGGSLAYRISKVSLNGLTKIMADELKGDNILVNTMCPGWVKTDMGGQNASRTVEQGADTAVWLAMSNDDGATGKFFRDRQEISW